MTFKINKNFYDKTDGFCEKYLWDNKKEYLNTITSLIISYFGLFGITQNDSNFNTDVLYSFLIVNGAFSGLNHWYNYKGWSYLDGITMMLPVTFGNLVIYKFFLNELSSDKNIEKLFYILYPTSAYLVLTLDLFASNFKYIFLGLSLALLGFIPLAIEYKGKYDLDYQKSCIDDIIANFIKGVLFVSIGAGLWFYSEPKCENKNIDPKIKKKLANMHLHSAWHIFSGYGFYLIIYSNDMINTFKNDPNIDNCNKIKDSLKKTIPRYH
jgi:hypothetical protein